MGGPTPNDAPGRPLSQVAEELGLTERTVKRYVREFGDVLGVKALDDESGLYPPETTPKLARVRDSLRSDKYSLLRSRLELEDQASRSARADPMTVWGLAGTAVGIVLGTIALVRQEMGSDSLEGQMQELREALVAQVDAESAGIVVGESAPRAGGPGLREPEKNRIWITGGTFLMGAQSRDPDAAGYDVDARSSEGPVREVTVSGFHMGRFPVTVQEYRVFVEAGGDGYLDRKHWTDEGWDSRGVLHSRSPGSWDQQTEHPNRPVVWVSWFEADAYCNWLGGRLPTEAEWEWAARGGHGRRFPWGDEPPTASHANFDSHVGHPTPVGNYPGGATPTGIHDLAGNVLEWCEDVSHGDYEGAPTDGTAREGGSGSRVLRGGAFDGNPRALRAADRYHGPPGIRGDLAGFRVVWVAAGGQD